MDKFIVHGSPEPLEGRINASGSKNSSLPILAATLLTPERCVIRRVPDVSDTNYMLQIIQNLGGEVERASGTFFVEAQKVKDEAPYELVRKMRASVCVMGPLLGRLKRCVVSLPGGCVIGARPIDLHLKGFEALGATVTFDSGNVLIEADELVGTEIDMMGANGSTVLGTDNVMMAAVLAKGTTVLRGAAAEPEVVDLAKFLNGMGAKIEGAGTDTITIHGVEELHGVEHTVIPDRIEAGTFLVAGALCGKKVELRRARADHMTAIIDKLREAGHQVDVTANPNRFDYDSDSIITVQPATDPQPCDLTTEPYPGYPTDMQAQMTALLALSPGESRITEKIFPQRFMHVAELQRMGANIRVEDNSAIITGVDGLSGAPVMASDLRASAALLLAAIPAKGQTEINRVYHIDRGYEHIDEKLNELGARIERIKV